MNIIKATITGGRLELDVPADWPDGTEVEIHLVGKNGVDTDLLTHEEIAKLLAAMDQLKPLEFTDAERAAAETQRQAQRDWEKARFAEHAGKLQGMWE
jgi:hypothetical protein